MQAALTAGCVAHAPQIVRYVSIPQGTQKNL